MLRLAGLDLPADRSIDGRDLWGAMSGTDPAPPHEALLFFDDKVVSGTRAGPWKFYRHVDRYYWPAPLDRPDTLSGRRIAGYPYRDENSGREVRLIADDPMLYDLRVDPGEAYNVASRHPERGRRGTGTRRELGAGLLPQPPRLEVTWRTATSRCRSIARATANRACARRTTGAAGAGPRVRLRIDRFAVTANTVTYAVTSDLLGYWDFFPTGEPGWGCVPAMGSDVVASNHTDVPTGVRYYGWLPMARFVDLTVTPTADGLRDEGPHRAAHAPVYRAFVATDRDPLYEAGADAEDRHALLRGLFLTGWLAKDHFADHGWFGADRVLVLRQVREASRVPLIASGSAGAPEHFADVFIEARVDGALAASVFHSAAIAIPDLKRYLRERHNEVRL